MSEWLCYCPGLAHPRRQLLPGDIAETLRRYCEEYGRPARVMRINKAFESWAVPAGVEVIYWPGCSLWEIDLADSVPVAAGAGE